MNILLTVIKFKYFNQKMTSSFCAIGVCVCMCLLHCCRCCCLMNSNDDGRFDIDDVDRRETHSICPDGRGKIRERAGRKTELNGTHWDLPHAHTPTETDERIKMEIVFTGELLQTFSETEKNG